MDLSKIPRVTGSDVARRAKVSRATVSYVLNDAPGQKISEQTRQAVLRAAEELGYRPNEAARSLASGRSRLVMLIVPHVRLGELVVEIASALTGELIGRGLTLSVHFAQPGPEHGDIADLAAQLDASAVMFIAPPTESVTDRLSASGIIALSLLGEQDSPMSIVNRRIGELQIDHLVERGHRSIAYARSDVERLDIFRLGREEGARGRAEARGLPDLQVEVLATSGEGAAAIVGRWHRSGVTAIAAYNDDVAFISLHGIRMAGLSCPDDVAVIGVDDETVGLVSAPPLTTIRAAPKQWATIAVDMLRRALDEPEEQVKPFGDDAAEVVQRMST